MVTCKPVCLLQQLDSRSMMVALVNNNTATLVNQGTVDALIITIAFIFVNSISTNMLSEYFAFLMNGDIG